MTPANSHYFHAEAHALKGMLFLPFEEQIKQQAFVKLEGYLADLSDEERAQRNYFSQHAKNFRLEGIISYTAAHTQVAGHHSKKHPGASVTLNVLNVVTADRVVAQVSTTHFPDEQTPAVTFLGTHFENLRIARHRAEPYLKLDMASDRPAGKNALHVDEGTGFMKAVEAQYKRLKASLKGLGGDDRKTMRLTDDDGSVPEKYHKFDLNYGDIKKQAAAALKSGDNWDGITCSLVENVEIKDISAKAADGKSVQIPLPGKSFGHVIHIPDFGNIFLAELTVNHNSFHLTMIRLDLGCLADGDVSIVTCNVNGKGSGGH
jgi:hypothetical protein